jgi:hypothetical protein
MCQNRDRPMRGAVQRTAALCVLSAALISPSPAFARPFEIGEVEGVANVELSYGLLTRVEDRESELVAIVNGGSAESANFDDGNLNYDEGVVSNMLQASGEVAARWRFLGVYVRGLAYYDFETQLSDHDRTLSGNAEHYVGTYAELLDYYVDARFRLGGMPVQIRVGDQVLSWGESTFLRFGLQSVTSLDLVAAFRPASSSQDVQIPQGMVWASALLTEELAIEAYYQYEWQRARTPPVGWWFSDTDLVGADGLHGAMAGAGLFSEQGTDLDAAFALPPGTLGFDPEFMRLPPQGSHEPSDQGQGGVTVQAILPRFASTKLALHFASYHSRLPLVSARSADAAAAAATSSAAVAARADALAAVYEAQGLPPAEAALAGAAAASTLTIGEYAGEAGYFVSYPEDIRMLGFSFNTATLRTGTLISGEVSHHFDYPFQLLPTDVFNAAFSPIEFTPAFGEGPLGDFGPDEVVRGFVRGGKTQLEVGLRQLLGPRFGASQTIVGIDVGWVHAHGLPSRDQLRLSAPGVTSPRDFDHLPDADSWGYRILAAMVFDNVLGAFSVQPHAAWLHDVGGVTPGPGGAFVEGRKAFNVGVDIDYTHTWLLQLDYTNLFGGGRFNLLSDRDFVRFQLTYFY